MIQLTLIGTSKVLTVISLLIFSYFNLDVSIKKKTNEKSTQTITEEILKGLGKEITQEPEQENDHGYNHIEKPLTKKKSYFSWQ